jgi:serine/threonine protein phosphatase PrpC
MQMQWRILAASTRGATHLRSGLPNQDAVAWNSPVADSVPLAAAVSDGHGSAKCFRSDAGARLAVNVATRLMKEFADSQAAASSLADIRGAAEKLPKNLVLAWRHAVEQSLSAETFSSEELYLLETRAGSGARQVVEENPVIAYGATVLAVLVAQSYVLYLQIGDGDILTVSDSGHVARPLPGDERLFANETTSLCLADAWHAARIELRNLLISPPALLLLSTDGYANSFGQDADFLAVGSDLLKIVRSEGLGVVKANLESWLAETSNAGSGDDVTVAVICRQDACAPVEATESSL